jgi:tape measure domain-containing protein
MSVEQKIASISKKLTFALSVPIVLFGKSILEAKFKMDTLKMSIETYSTSTEEAAKVTEDLKNLALELPTVKVEDLSDSIGNLLARGVATKDLVDTFKMFAIITGATGGSMKGLVKAYTDTMGKGKLAGQEFNQFINASVPISKALTDYFGGKKTLADLKVMQKNGKITFEVLRDALKGLAVEGGKFHEIMGKKSDMLWGRFQKFQDVFFYLKVKLAPFLELISKKVLGFAERLVMWFEKLSSNSHRFIIIAMAVATIIPPMVALVNIFSKLMGPAGIVLVLMAGLALAIDDIYVWVKGGDSLLGRMFGDYKNYEKTIQAIVEQMGLLLKNVKDLLATVVSQPLDLIKWITGGQDVGVLSLILNVIGGIAKTVNLLIFDVTSAIRLVNALFKFDFAGAAKIGAEFNKRNFEVLIKGALSAITADAPGNMTYTKDGKQVTRKKRSWGEFLTDTTPFYLDPRAGEDGKGYRGGFWNSVTDISTKLGRTNLTPRLHPNTSAINISKIEVNAPTPSMPMGPFQELITKTITDSLNNYAPSTR